MAEPIGYCDCEDHYPESLEAAIHRLRMDADALSEPQRTTAHAYLDQGDARFRDLQAAALADLMGWTR